MVMTKEELAKRAIEEFLRHGKRLVVDEDDVPDAWKKQGACFVTLYIQKRLRGCIGSPQAFEPLYKNIIRNAVEAGFGDPRFPELQERELELLTIEVSVLTPAKPYHPKTTEEFLTFLQKEKPGVILNLHGRRALFLPQVWEELPDPKEFLTQLSLKAGLETESWKDLSTTYQIFSVE